MAGDRGAAQGRRVAAHGLEHRARAGGSTLFAGLDPGTRFYFVHSFAVRRWELEPSDVLRPPLVTWAQHGEEFVAAVENGALAATQFHPEKSGDAGASLLRNWLRDVVG